MQPKKRKNYFQSRIPLFPSGDQNIGASASVSILPMTIQNWFPLGLTGLISLLYKGLSGVFSSTTVQRHPFFGSLPSLWSSSHIHMWPWEDRSLVYWTVVGRVMSLLFNTLSRFVMAFLPRSNCTLISWLRYYSCFTDRKSCNDL